jgi:hypothetical protein
MERLTMRVLSYVAVLMAAVAFGHTAQTVELLANGGFEQGIEGWNKNGNVVAAADQKVKHSGNMALSLQLAEGVAPAFQSMFCDLSVNPGDKFTAECWMRTSEKPREGGAYLAVEYLDKAGARVGLEQPPVVAATRGKDWEQRSTPCTVPASAVKMRVHLLLHERLQVWFDDVSITGEPPPPLKLTLQSDRVISRNWLGFGAQGDLWLSKKETVSRGVTDVDRTLVKKRIIAMKPSLIRLFTGLDSYYADERGKLRPDCPEMKDLIDTLTIYKEAGADIAVTGQWGDLPKWLAGVDKRIPKPELYAAWGDCWAGFVKYLRVERGFTNVRYVVLFNEPDGLPLKPEVYMDLARAADAGFRRAKIRDDIAMLGPDETDGSLWIQQVASAIDHIIDVYDSHSYSAGTPAIFGEWLQKRLDAVPKPSDPQKRKPFVVGEFGMGAVDALNSKENGKYDYGLFVSGCAIQTAARGASGAMNWCLSDTYYWESKMQWGLWRFRDEGWEPRPGFYAWSLITRYTERGSSVHPVTAEPNSSPVVAFRGPKLGWTLLMTNESGASRSASWSGLPAKSIWEPYVYAPDTVPTKDRGLIPAGKEMTADARGTMTQEIPARSFVLLHEKR